MRRLQFTFEKPARGWLEHGRYAGLRLVDHAVLGLLVHLARDYEDGRYYVMTKHKDLAELMPGGLTRQTISSSLSRLEAVGLVKVEHDRGQWWAKITLTLAKAFEVPKKKPSQVKKSKKK